jgi:hypothetical protein
MPEENTTRKASDVLLDLEIKLNELIVLVKSLDLNLKILNNKYNTIIEKVDSINKTNVSKSSVSIEAVTSGKVIPQYNNSFMPPNSQNLIPITANQTLPLETNPVGFLRTSRPETFTGKAPTASVIPNNEAIVNLPMGSNKEESSPPNTNTAKRGGTPVVQRIVDKNGKSIFLADVEILDKNTNEQFFKGRTNAVGRWSASLPGGEYKIMIKKLESATKEKLEAIQNIVVDGSQSPVELKTLIIKG